MFLSLLVLFILNRIGIETYNACTQKYVLTGRPSGVGEPPVVVNPAYNLQEEVLALRAAPLITDDELDTQLEIGELFKCIVLLMMPLWLLKGVESLNPNTSRLNEAVNSTADHKMTDPHYSVG